jgi:tRNA-specific 2-thiouridylase
VVAVGDEDPALYRTELTATEITETIPSNLEKYYGKKIQARVRYRQPLAWCAISPFQGDKGGRESEGVEVRFDAPQRAIASGQFVAFYDGGELLGSGVIF